MGAPNSACQRPPPGSRAPRHGPDPRSMNRDGAAALPEDPLPVSQPCRTRWIRRIPLRTCCCAGCATAKSRHAAAVQITAAEFEQWEPPEGARAGFHCERESEALRSKPCFPFFQTPHARSPGVRECLSPSVAAELVSERCKNSPGEARIGRRYRVAQVVRAALAPGPPKLALGPCYLAFFSRRLHQGRANQRALTNQRGQGKLSPWGERLPSCQPVWVLHYAPVVTLDRLLLPGSGQDPWQIDCRSLDQ